MGTAPRQLWLAALEDTLKGITTSSGYKSSVVTAERVVRAPEDIPNDRRPYIGIQTGKGVPEYHPSYGIRCVEAVTLYCYVPHEGDDKATAGRIDNLLDDIFAALGQDPVLSEAATDVKVVEYDSDESDSDKDDQSGVMLVALSVTYHREARSS